MLNDILAEIEDINRRLRPRYWGIWNDGIGWWVPSPPEIFATVSYAHAKAQRQLVAQSRDTHQFTWSVRSFEEWADEQ